MYKFSFSRYFKEEYFPISVTVMPASGIRYPTLHSHEFSELVIMSEGSIEHHCGSSEITLRSGDFFLIHPGTSHAYSNPSEDALLYNLLYDSTVPIPMLMMSSMPFLQQVYPVDKSGLPPYTGIISHASKKSLPLIVNALERIREEVKRRRPGHYILITSLFMEVALLLARNYTEEVKDDPDWMLNKVVGFLKCHYAEKIEVRDLVHIAGMSESTLLRRFKSAFGIGPMEYLIELRVRHAAILLKNRNLKLAAIAAECGFCDSSHLWKAMNKKLHLTPADIRRRKKEN